MNKLSRAIANCAYTGNLNDILSKIINDYTPESGTLNDRILILGKREGYTNVTETYCNIDSVLLNKNVVNTSDNN